MGLQEREARIEAVIEELGRSEPDAAEVLRRSGWQNCLIQHESGGARRSISASHSLNPDAPTLLIGNGTLWQKLDDAIDAWNKELAASA